jgi:hypothetical protein
MILFLGNNPRRIIPSHSVLRNERLLLLLGESERFFVRFTLIIGPTNKQFFLFWFFHLIGAKIVAKNCARVAMK